MKTPSAAALIPPGMEQPGIQQLLEIVAMLRGPGGCPWDREQTHGSLRAAVLEEAYELVAAIEACDDANLREELGDLLLQTVFHAQLAAEQGRFNFDDVARTIAAKLVRRHPHVFGKTSCANSAEVLQRWEDLKRAEKGPRTASLLDDLPRGLPALMQATRVQKKVGTIGFDWSEVRPVIAKVREELAELEAEIANPLRRPATDPIEDELGDLLFATVNLARKLRVDPEVALHRATAKFSARFRHLEQLAGERGLILEKLTLLELDALWEEVKASPPAGPRHEE